MFNFLITSSKLMVKSIADKKFTCLRPQLTTNFLDNYWIFTLTQISLRSSLPFFLFLLEYYNFFKFHCHYCFLFKLSNAWQKNLDKCSLQTSWWNNMFYAQHHEWILMTTIIDLWLIYFSYIQLDSLQFSLQYMVFF